MRRAKAPMAIPAMAPAGRLWCDWLLEDGFVPVVADVGGWGVWLMVTGLGLELMGNSAWEMEKFPCS